MDRLEEAGVKFKCWRQIHLGAKTNLKPHQPESAETIALGCILKIKGGQTWKTRVSLSTPTSFCKWED